MRPPQLVLFDDDAAPRVPHANAASFIDELRRFTWKDKQTLELEATVMAAGQSIAVPVLINEFWTSRQRAAHSLQEVSYRACFKPQLPRFFIERLTEPGQTVYDPFSGRGTTALEAALLGRIPVACDINPLSRILLEARLSPPPLSQIVSRLNEIPWSDSGDIWEDLLVFYHPETLRHISALRRYLVGRDRAGNLDRVDRWLRMVAVNRLTGHSPGFFSVYTLPPNQAVSLQAQVKINAQREQVPAKRAVARLILAKSRSLLADVTEQSQHHLDRVAAAGHLLTAHAASTPDIPSESVDLVVTSPPFLDVVDYAGDNWLRCWFCGIDPKSVGITIAKQPTAWQDAMRGVFVELSRVLRPGGFVAFEVGEVRGGRLKLEELVLPAAMGAGFEPCLVLVNAQKFTKTANCWGVTNNQKGTNSNRIVLLRKPASWR
ncbi:MAG: site-specific DNA-methyltransferase [Acidobacteria bacterium]|nr:site-specific DNA-methyltransferase [Acidobacteriota bacterium]